MEIYLSAGRGASDPYNKINFHKCSAEFLAYLKHNEFSQKYGCVFSDGAAGDAMARSMRLGA